MGSCNLVLNRCRHITEENHNALRKAVTIMQQHQCIDAKAPLLAKTLLLPQRLSLEVLGSVFLLPHREEVLLGKVHLQSWMAWMSQEVPKRQIWEGPKWGCNLQDQQWTPKIAAEDFRCRKSKVAGCPCP